jgi:hypothetical protein
MQRRVRVDEAEFRRLWAAGMSRLDLATHFDCSMSFVDSYRARIGLPIRKDAVPQVCYSPFDPTPEQIAERARECRERHYAARRGETEHATHNRVSRRRRLGNLQEAG